MVYPVYDTNWKTIDIYENQHWHRSVIRSSKTRKLTVNDFHVNISYWILFHYINDFLWYSRTSILFQLQSRIFLSTTILLSVLFTKYSSAMSVVSWTEQQRNTSDLDTHQKELIEQLKKKVEELETFQEQLRKDGKALQVSKFIFLNRVCVKSVCYGVYKNPILCLWIL